MLSYPCTPTLLLEFQESWNRYCQRVHGGVGHSFERNAYPIRAPPNLELGEDYDDYDEASQDLVRSGMIKSHASILARDREHVDVMYGELLSQLLPDAENEIRSGVTTGNACRLRIS